MLVEPLPRRAGGSGNWVGMPCVVLPMHSDFVIGSDMSRTGGAATRNEAEEAKRLMCLWGLTLPMVDDLLLSCGLRKTQLAHALRGVTSDASTSAHTRAKL
eukprot:COSAG05_NODE_146_length_16405_cov_993.952104_4_plen_101_part_00